MRKALFIIAALFSMCASAQVTGNKPFWGLLRSAAAVNPCPNPPCNTNFSFSDIPATTDFSRYGGSQNWNFQSGCQIVGGVPAPLSLYRRFFWSDLEGNTQGSWQFDFDNRDNETGRLRAGMEEALSNEQLFAFGVGTLYPDPDLGGFSHVNDYNGFFSMYPQYVHNSMQSSGLSDFDDGESWLPNYNHTAYLGRFRQLFVNLKNWFDTAIIRVPGRQVPARFMLQYIDIRGYGSYGEWHHCCQGDGYNEISNWVADQPGRFGTVATMKELVDIQVDIFNTTNIVAIINTMDAGWQWGTGGPVGFNNTKIPAEVGIYILQKSNLAGPVGLRRDQVGNNEQYYHEILEDNDMTFGGSPQAKDMIMTRYQTAYFVGEPQGGPPYDCPNVNMGCAPGQVRLYHMYSYGNGNYGGCTGPPNETGVDAPDSVRTSFRLAGARIKLNGGSMSTTLQQNAQFNVTLTMQNIGVAAEHRAWTTTYELRNGANNAVWTSSVPFSIKGFYSGMGIQTLNNNFTLPGSVPVGTYRLVIKIVDPTGYLDPYPLGTNGREGDGIYQMRANIQVLAGS